MEINLHFNVSILICVWFGRLSACDITVFCIRAFLSILARNHFIIVRVESLVVYNNNENISTFVFRTAHYVLRFVRFSKKWRWVRVTVLDLNSVLPHHRKFIDIIVSPSLLIFQFNSEVCVILRANYAVGAAEMCCNGWISEHQLKSNPKRFVLAGNTTLIHFGSAGMGFKV